MKEGPLAGQRIPVDAEVVVGRVEADLTIDDPLISRRHATIRPHSAGLEIEDLGSLNGTWVNGERVDGRRVLAGGDLVQVGDASFEVEVAVEPAAPAKTVFAPALGRDAERDAARPAPREPREADPASTEDELRPVTALFADVVGSTTLGERLSPDEVKLVIGEFVGRMTRAVEHYGGFVQAYMGDGIAAFFGAAGAHEDDAERAARAALGIVAEVEEYARAIERSWQISDFNVRVGINTGPAAVGLVGGDSPQPVAVGDTTNVAARLEASAEPGEIVVGESTAKLLIRTFALEPLGDVSVKGRHEPVSAWRLVAAQAALQSSIDTPIVGRGAELAQLNGILAELANGRGQIAVLLGEAGLGKTRLVAEERRRSSGAVTWLEGHCLSYGTEVIYGPFIQILRNWIGAEDGEAELLVWTKLRAKLGLLPAAQIPDVLPFLARVLSLRIDPAAEERFANMSPPELAHEIRRAYRTWLASLAGQGPVVAVIEDIHWADPSSRQLVDELFELVDEAPLLFLLTLRIDQASEGWKTRLHALSDYPHRTTELRLPPLDDAAARRLLHGLPPSSGLSESELDLVVTAAEGNPLYLEELLNAFVEHAGSLANHTWAPTAARPRVLTPTLESLLLARIDSLSDHGRRLAQLAAMIGRSFPVRVLEHIAGSDSIDDDLTEVVRADIIRELRRYPEREYIFRHGLLRQACLSTLPTSRRRALHGAVATAFETLFAGDLDTHYEVIAYHYARSEDAGKALLYLERAGERAAALDANQRAEELWRRALMVADKVGDTATAQSLQDRLAGLGPSPS
jgi:class 3 adenylate cyclase